MNKDKVIKDLRERNDKLQSQYYMVQSRCWNAENKNIKLKEKINKAINILKYSASNKGMCTQPSTDPIQSALLVLQGDDNNA